MKNISIHLALSLSFIALVIGLLFGYYLTPEYQQTMYDKNEMSLGLADRFLDKRYINAMISHHRAAMLLANQAKDKSQRPEIRNLSHDILSNEPKLINELYNWKMDWYQDSKQVPDPIVPNLGDFNNSYDLRFLNALIAHHEEGIKMTKEVRLKSSRTEILDNANNVEEFLTTTLRTFRNWRFLWYEQSK